MTLGIQRFVDFLQVCTDLGVKDIARAVGLPHVVVVNLLRRGGDVWESVPGPEVVSRLALASLAVSLDHQDGPAQGDTPEWHLRMITEAACSDPIGLGARLCDGLEVLAMEIGVPVEDLEFLDGARLSDLLHGDRATLLNYCRWLDGYIRCLVDDEQLPLMLWSDWSGGGVALSMAA